MTTDNKAPREICPHCQGFDYREEHEINLKCLKENVKLQLRLEKCEGLLREISPVLEENFIIYHDCGDMDNEQVIECHGKIKKYFAEVER